MRTISESRPTIIAARLADFRLDPHRDHQQAEIVLGDALEHVFERARQRQSDPGLLEHGAEFAAERIGELADHDLQARAAANGRPRATI